MNKIIPTPIAGLSMNGFVVQRAGFENFPKKGFNSGIYIDSDTGFVYYWKDDAYHLASFSTEGYRIEDAILMLKCKTEEEWTTENPVLEKGEVAVISDKNLFKVGDGTTSFTDLPILKANANDVPNWAMKEVPEFEIKTITGLEQNLEEKRENIEELQELVGGVKVGTQIQTAITNLNLEDTYEPIGAEARAKLAFKETTEPMIAEAQAVREIAESKTTMAEVEAKDYATNTQVQNSIAALENNDLEVSNYFVTSVSQKNGVIGIKRKTISQNDIPTLSQLKIQNLPETLDNKQNLISWQNNNYDSKSNKAITQKDLEDAFNKVSSAVKFRGIVTALPKSAENGDLYIVGSKEYVYIIDDSGSRFEELGDQSLHAIKGEISNNDIAPNAAISQDKIAGLQDALDAKENINRLGTMAYEEKSDYTTENKLSETIQGLAYIDATVDNQFIYNVSQNNGLISVKRRALAEADIPTLQIDKIVNLQDLLDAKLAVSTFKNEKEAIYNLLGTEAVSTQISTAINNLKIPETYETIANVNKIDEKYTASTNASNARISVIEKDYLTSADKTQLSDNIKTAKEDVLNSIMGEAGIDEKYDTLKEIADWILSDTTASAQLVIRVSSLEEKRLDTIKYVDGSTITIGTDHIIPLRAATNTLYGTVKGTEKENYISMVNGEMEVYSLNANKLVQTAGEIISINCGTSTEVL